MFGQELRSQTWSELISQRWDLLVIGGGITGAGIMQLATQKGLKVALIEQQDFAWGTSSRSSKLVHGGLRYLREGKISLTRESVKERERLLLEAPGLVEQLDFLVPVYEGEKPGKWIYAAGLFIYNILARRRHSKFYKRDEILQLAPQLNNTGLKGGFRYVDAQTDDARLVLRLIREGVQNGALACNYVKAEELLVMNGKVSGARIRDLEDNRVGEVTCSVVVNATGAWADNLRSQIVNESMIRPLRGSHLVLRKNSLPLSLAVAFLHPSDRRPVFAVPWEGVILIGTTDTDHEKGLSTEPSITIEEAHYLMEAVHAQFPGSRIDAKDIISTYAGVRPVVSSGSTVEPSKESRDYILQEEAGLLTVTGGKLTTFGVIANSVIGCLKKYFPHLNNGKRHPSQPPAYKTQIRNGGQILASHEKRLIGRYGRDAQSIIDSAIERDLQVVPGTNTLWAELLWCARNESVVHLDDLLLRRVRLGLLLPLGGEGFLPDIRELCQEGLGWDDTRWDKEVSRYLEIYRKYYGNPL